MNFKIRTMSEEDVGFVAAIERECFSDAWSENLLERGIKNLLETYMVLEMTKEDGLSEIAGYCCLLVVAGEGELQRIAVKEKYRGQGYGRKLMDAIDRFSTQENLSAMTLEVRASNKTAINLYKLYGFEEEAVRKMYYHHPDEDAVIMWKRSKDNITT